MRTLDQLLARKGFICDMDGVLYHGNNPLIMRHALKRIGCQREDAVIIGDRMDTDIVAGIESEIETVLVLTGVTSQADLARFPYRPHHVLKDLREFARRKSASRTPRAPR